MKSLINFIILIPFFTFPIFSQSTPSSVSIKKLAILDLRYDSSIDESKYSELNEYLKKEIRSMDIFEITEPELVQRIIEEEAEELRGCENLSCAIIIGEKAESDKVLDGFVKKVGNSYVFSIQIIDPKNKKAEFNEGFSLTKSEKYQDEIQEFKSYLKTYSKGEKIVKTKSKWPYVWRSMVLPGWGQWHDGRYKKAYIYGGVFLGLGLFYLNNLNNFNKAESNYKSVIPIPATAEQDTFVLNYARLAGPKEEYQNAEKTTNNSLYLLTAFYLWNVFDAYYYSAKTPPAQSVSFFIGRDSIPSGQIQAIGSYYQFSYTFQF